MKSDKQYMNLNRPNVILFLYVLLFVLISAVVKNLSGENTRIVGIVYATLGCGLGFVTDSFGRAITAFEPCTPLSARRANEQIKFIANFFNTVAAAVVSILAITQFQKPEGFNLVEISTAAAAALYIHTRARSLIGLIKDDSPESFES